MSFVNVFNCSFAFSTIVLFSVTVLSDTLFYIQDCDCGISHVFRQCFSCSFAFSTIVMSSIFLAFTFLEHFYAYNMII